MSNLFEIVLGFIDPTGIQPFEETTEVPDTETNEAKESKEKQLRDQDERATRQQLLFNQEKLNYLRQSAELQPTNETNFEDLERQEEKNDAELENQTKQDMLNKMTQQQQQTQVQNTLTMQTMANCWVRAERADAKIIFNKNAAIHCDVAVTPRQQASGLQAYEGLDIDRGLWFPQNSKRIASFHMGNVQFPIDIIFIDDNKVAKVIDNVRPGQFGSWACSCTDVIEVNGNWAVVNNINPGDFVETPTNKIASASNSYDPLRALTQASDDDENWEEELFDTFPFLRQAQENRQVKPDSHQRTPGEVETRNPLDRFIDHDLGSESSPFGDRDRGKADPFGGLANPSNNEISTGTSGTHWDKTLGADPELSGNKFLTPAEEDSFGTRDPTRTGSFEDFSGLDQDNLERLMNGSIILLSRNPLEWGPSSDSEYSKEALITDLDIDDWITSLDWVEDDKNKLRTISNTDNYKKLLGRVLQDTISGIRGFEIKESNLHLYR